jgi:O-antigen/teichoic acid export membrane protein
MLEPKRTVSRDLDQFFQTDHLRKDLKGHSARSGLLTVSSQGVKFVLSTLSAIILARLLTPSDYGIVGMVAIVLNFASMFQYLGLAGATVQWPEINHRQVSTLFWLNIGLSTAIALLMAAGSPVIAWFFQEPRVIAVTIGYSLSVFVTGLWIQHEAILTRQMRFDVLVAVDIAALVIGLIVTVIVALRGFGYWALVYNQLTITLVQAISYWFICKWRPGLPSWGSGIRPMLRFGGHFTGTNLMSFFSRNMDNILIGRVWGVEQLGLYSRSYQLLMLPIQQIYSPISSVTLPALSRLVNSPNDYRKAYLRIVEKIAMITMPGVTLMCVCSDWLVLFVLGPQWSETARIFTFLGLAAFVQPVSRTFYWLLSTQLRTREMFVWSVIAAALAVMSIVAGLPWGAVGVAASYAITDLFIQTPLLLWLVGRKGPVGARHIYKTLAPPVCASVVTLLVLSLSRPWIAELDFLVVRLLISFAFTLLASLAVFALLPKGRIALNDIKELTLHSIFRRKAETVPANNN